MFNEEELISGALKGELQAFNLLVKQYEKLVFHVVNRLVAEQQDAEDICQEVFIKVYKNLGQFKFQSKLSTWIARIAYLTAISYLKKYKKAYIQASQAELDYYYFTEDDPQQLLIKKDVSAYINHLIARMPEQYRVLLTLFHLDEFSYQEIEAITGMPEGTVKNYLFRARKLLKEKLEIYLKLDV
jgi:RNA polymerase sigma-70 factor (ECF subfamily)